MKFKTIAHACLIMICAFSVTVTPAFAATVVYDEEAERAELDGMNKEKALSITHVIAANKYQGSVKFTFEAPQDGTYLIEAKTLATDRKHDSFNVALDGSDITTWHVPNNDIWQWNPVAVAGSKDGLLSLEEGKHTLTFYGREQTRLDRIKITLTGSDDSIAPETTDPEVITEPEPKPVEETAPVTGTSWYVDRDGSDNDAGTRSKPFESINQALEKAQAGDTIFVAAGTYTEKVQTVRSGTKEKPITITALDTSNRPVLDLKWDLNGPVIRHSYITLQNFEIKNFDEGVRIEGATGVRLLNNEIHHGENECVRVRYESTNNLIEGNEIHFCGATSPTSRIGGGNGEGIYIGTAPEQRDKNDGKPDQSVHNQIVGNTIYDVTEGVDLKEDSHYTIVKGNELFHASDKNSGAINVRGDKNTITNNLSYKNTGSGYRFGGDSGVIDSDGETHTYGEKNIISNNESRDNDLYGYKFMNTDQDFSCDNTFSNNDGGATNKSSAFSCFQ